MTPCLPSWAQMHPVLSEVMFISLTGALLTIMVWGIRHAVISTIVDVKSIFGRDR